GVSDGRAGSTDGQGQAFAVVDRFATASIYSRPIQASKRSSRLAQGREASWRWWKAGGTSEPNSAWSRRGELLRLAPAGRDRYRAPSGPVELAGQEGWHRGP